MDLETTALILAGLGGVFGLCLWGERKERHPGKVRMVPYVPVMMICLVFILGLLAHLVSLLTGQPISGRY